MARRCGGWGAGGRMLGPSGWWLVAGSWWLVAGSWFAAPLIASPHPLQSVPEEGIPQTVEFDRDVRPILSDKCYTCHGPSKQMAGLRFDREEGAKHALREERFAVVPGDASRSEMIRRITLATPVGRMPQGGEPLSGREIAIIRRWIEQGAAWQTHWSFVPPKRPDLPKVKDRQWVRNPIDAFVLERLEREG